MSRLTLPGSLDLLALHGDESGGTLAYLYDFGDGWEHTIRLDEVAPVGGVGEAGGVADAEPTGPRKPAQRHTG